MQPKNKYYIAEIIREKNLFLCIIKNQNNTLIKKLSLIIPKGIMPSSINLSIVAGGDKSSYVYIDDLEVSMY